jgi:hypothetical protein
VSALTWNEDVWCVTCGTTDKTRKFHLGHVISRSDMKGYLPWLNQVSNAMKHRQHRDNDVWNIVHQCRECNYRTHAGQAAINYPSCEREALWAAINLHNELRLCFHSATAGLAFMKVADAMSEQQGEASDAEYRERTIKMAVKEAERALGLIEGACDLPTLRMWYAELQEPS